MTNMQALEGSSDGQGDSWRSCTYGIDATRQRCTLLLLPAGQSKATLAAGKGDPKGTAASEQAEKEGPARHQGDCRVLAPFTEMWVLP